MKNIKVKHKMLIIVGIMDLNMLLIVIFSAVAMHALDNISEDKLASAIRVDYDQRIKEQVENANSMVNGVMEMVNNGDATEEEALENAARALRGIRYGEDGYFWADTVEGVNVVLLGSDTEGVMRLHAKDADGFEFVNAIIEAAKKGGGYVDYKFAKEGENVPLPKRAYSMLNERTGWVIGTGNYIDDMEADIDAHVSAMRKRIILITTLMIAMSLVMIVITFAIATGISRSIVKALKTSYSYIESMAGGDFTTEISEEMLDRKDDFGQLAEKLEFLKDAVGKLIKSVKIMAETVDENTYTVDAELNKVNGDIDDVCANVQELTAVFTETASSMDQLTGFAISVGDCTEELYNRTRDSVQKILEIHHKLEDDQNHVLEEEKAGLSSDDENLVNTERIIAESEDYANYVDKTLAEIEDMSAVLSSDMESLMESIGQISDVCGQGALGVESIENSIIAIRSKTADLEEASKTAQDVAAQMDYEVAKFAVR